MAKPFVNSSSFRFAQTAQHSWRATLRCFVTLTRREMRVSCRSSPSAGAVVSRTPDFAQAARTPAVTRAAADSHGASTPKSRASVSSASYGAERPRHARGRQTPQVSAHEAVPALDGGSGGGNGSGSGSFGAKGRGNGDGDGDSGDGSAWEGPRRGRDSLRFFRFLWAGAASAAATATSLRVGSSVCGEEEDIVRLGMNTTGAALQAALGPLMLFGGAASDVMAGVHTALTGGAARQSTEDVHPFERRWPSAAEEGDADSEGSQTGHRGGNLLSLGLASVGLRGGALMPSSSRSVTDVETVRRQAAQAVRAAAEVVRSAVRTASFESDAASGTGSTVLGHRFEKGALLKNDSVLLTLQLPTSAATAPLVTVAARGCTATFAPGTAGLLHSLDVPDIVLADGRSLLLVRPSLRPGLSPCLHATWHPSPEELAMPVPSLDGGAARVDATVGLDGCLAALSYHVRRAAAASTGREATHSLRLVATAGIGSQAAAALRATYKLRMLREGVTVGASLGAGADASGKQPASSFAPAVAFAKTRWANGCAVRVYVGLASSVIGARVTMPEAGARGRRGAADAQWVTNLAWADGALKSAALSRHVAL